MVAASDDEDNRLSDKELFANILTLLLAGEDTTSNLIAWMLYFIRQMPDVQQKIAEEAHRISSMHDGSLCVQGLEELNYLEAVARETLRLKSTAPMISAETASQQTLLDGTELPAGTCLFLLTRLGGLNAAHFPDAEQFQPERWLEGTLTQEACPHRATSHFPFGGGGSSLSGRNTGLHGGKNGCCYALPALRDLSTKCLHRCGRGICYHYAAEKPPSLFTAKAVRHG